MNEIGLNDRWEGLAYRLGVANECFYHETVGRLYSNPLRHYHTEAHLVGCFSVLDEAKGSGCDDLAGVLWDYVEAAIFMHDVVYDARSNQNEEDSAAMSVAVFRKPFVGELIKDTKHQQSAESKEGQVVCDIDLSSLGGDFDKFLANSRNIRKEYDFVSDDDYRKGRTAIMGAFLRKDRIYQTDYFRDRFEMKARNNIVKYIQEYLQESAPVG